MKFKLKSNTLSRREKENGLNKREEEVEEKKGFLQRQKSSVSELPEQANSCTKTLSVSRAES